MPSCSYPYELYRCTVLRVGGSKRDALLPQPFSCLTQSCTSVNIGRSFFANYLRISPPHVLVFRDLLLAPKLKVESLYLAFHPVSSPYPVHLVFINIWPCTVWKAKRNCRTTPNFFAPLNVEKTSRACLIRILTMRCSFSRLSRKKLKNLYFRSLYVWIPSVSMVKMNDSHIHACHVCCLVVSGQRELGVAFLCRIINWLYAGLLLDILCNFVSMVRYVYKMFYLFIVSKL